MEKIRFLETYTVQDAEARQYEQGHEYEVSEDTAQHFVSRGKAERVAKGKDAKGKDAKTEPPKA